MTRFRAKLSTKRIPALEIVLPASSANLGPAFDAAAAMALRFHLRVRALMADEFTIAAVGRDADVCARLDRNLLLETYQEVLQSEGKQAVPLSIQIENNIPLGKGLGSSAAARLAGISLAVHFGKLRWSDDRILAEAAEREQHGDNVAACWMGGVVLVHSNGDRDAGERGITALKLHTRSDWPLLVAIPKAQLSTPEARAVLPATYSRADAVANVQNAMFLTAAFVQGRPDLFGFALRDRIHEPYRGPLCPLLAPLQSLSGQKGILGAVLSGAGPSVLVMLVPGESAVAARRRIAGFLRSKGLAAELLPTSIERRGACEQRRALKTRTLLSRSKR